LEYFVLHFQLFLLVMVRLGAMIVIAPLFSSGVIPMKFKGLLAFFLALVIFPGLYAKGITLPPDLGKYYVMVFGEIVTGLYIGFLVSIIFTAFQLSGQYFAVQIGFGISEVLDPLAQVSVPIVGQLKNLIGLLVFLSMNGHHLMLEAIYRSYELAPFVNLNKVVTGSLMKFLLSSFSFMFIVAMKIAIPIVGTVFLISVSMGVLAKAAPQMNIMMLGFPFKIIVAFSVLVLISPLVIRVMHVSLEKTFRFVSEVLVHWPM
jgi:flagellar biosynthesis protein FliR